MIFASLAPLIHCSSSLAIARYLPLPLKFSIIFKSLSKDGLSGALSLINHSCNPRSSWQKSRTQNDASSSLPALPISWQYSSSVPVSVQCTMYRIFRLSIPIPKAFVATTMSNPFSLSSKKAPCTRLRSWDSSPA